MNRGSMCMQKDIAGESQLFHSCIIQDFPVERQVPSTRPVNTITGMLAFPVRRDKNKRAIPGQVVIE